LQRFFETGSKAGIQPKHSDALQARLALLNRAKGPQDLPDHWRPHPLKGEMSGKYSIWVSGNWRLTFAFEEGDVVVLDYVDYH